MSNIGSGVRPSTPAKMTVGELPNSSTQTPCTYPTVVSLVFKVTMNMAPYPLVVLIEQGVSWDASDTPTYGF